MFDLLVVLVVGVSTAFAALRGGLRELSTLLALAFAGGLTLLLVEPLLAATGQAGSFFATVAVAAVLVAIFFVLAHIVLHLGLKRMPLEGKARLYDRVGGGVFGLARGLILVGLGYLGYSYYLDEARQPDEVRNAITRPVAAAMADWFESFAPESAYIESQPLPEPKGDATVQGYDRGDRNGLSEIVTTVTTDDGADSQDASAESGDEDKSEDAIADILAEDNE